MTLYKGCLKQNDLGPSKMLRYLETFLSWLYDDPRPSRLHPKIGLFPKSAVNQQCQRNKNAQERLLSRYIASSYLINLKTILAIFKNKHLHFQNILQNLKTFLKDQTSLYTFLRTRIITKTA